MNDPHNPYQSPREAAFTPGGAPTDFTPKPVMAEFRTAANLCMILVVLLGVQILLDTVLVGMGLAEFNYYSQGVSFDEFDLTDSEMAFLLAYAGVGIVQLLALIVTIIFFCIWNYRVYKNVLALGTSRLQHSPGWAAGSWFVPILNLFRPYQIMQETWKGSDPENLPRQGETYRRPEGSSLIGWWWAAWIIGGIANQVAFRTEMRADGDLNVLQISAIASIVGAAISVVCGGLAIGVVRGITNNQEERHQLLRGVAPRETSY